MTIILMANITTNLPVPEGKAYGEPVDVSGMGHNKIINLTGNLLGVVAIEATHGEGESARWIKIATFTAPGRRQIKGVFRFMRAVVLDIGPGDAGRAEISIAGRKRETMFVTIPVPEANDDSAAFDVSDLGPEWTIMVDVGKNFGGAIVVESAHDEQQRSWAQAAPTFTGSAMRVAKVEGAFARVARLGYTTNSKGEPVVTIGAEKD